MSLLSWLLTLVGLFCLALAMADHHRWLMGHDPSTRTQRLLRGIGILLLTLSWLAAAGAWGPALGSIAWCGLLTVAAAPLVLARTYIRTGRR
ncbi:MAG: DUF3325 domain-containing protein [Niveispirillum sp.]|uniref:DUF3325 domain-containing protein n=1 Tax=Niveispirillum sp. TaxID=1917217 RepID=UPI003BA59770